jgi:hypothetical protein
MAQRGRKSSASLAVLPFVKPEPPAPQAGLTEEQAEVWRSIVSTMPHSWFPPETYDLLALLCRHVTTARVIWGQIAKVDPAELARFDRLSKMATRESRSISMLATKLRLTNQSRYDPKTAGRIANEPRGSGLKPWERHVPSFDFVP